MRLYNEKLSRLSENKRNQANIEDTERLAEKYNWQLEELKTRGIARQKERLKTREDLNILRKYFKYKFIFYYFYKILIKITDVFSSKDLDKIDFKRKIANLKD